MQPGQIYEAKTKQAEHAFFSLVKNNCDLTYMIKIDNYIQAKYRRSGNNGLYKGSEILAYLRQLILSDDPALKRHARQAIEALRIHSNESISRFNNRFSKAIRDFEIRGGGHWLVMRKSQCILTICRHAARIYVPFSISSVTESCPRPTLTNFVSFKPDWNPKRLEFLS
jgi:hypothetical protein